MRVAAAFAALLVGSTVAGGSFAQRIYVYRDASGAPVYTDRPPPSGSVYDERDLGRQLERPQVQLLQRETEGGVQLVARNTYFAPVQIAYRLVRVENVSADTPATGLEVVPARADADLVQVLRADLGVTMSFEYEFQYLPGEPGAVHAPAQPYRLPYALARSFAVTQAFPDQITHRDPASQHAIDFAMPVGTAVYAARGGIVIDVASDYYEAGLDPAEDGPRANIVRVLHEDGTMALYAHLNWNSIRVEPGQSVARGEYLADSGNTGFSSGPHLHFVVQRNRGGAIESVPIEFAGAGGAAVGVRRGDAPTAY
ncbi:MAG: M23 family metallopeptidase [Gammaproteobacteria bacterium]|nr:M23 family metallopeptidase [Gammaproteobacteria bacterium]